ncbi:MAG: hypothetical protein ABIP33_11655 [Pseudolysinimonas sp.]
MTPPTAADAFALYSNHFEQYESALGAFEQRIGAALAAEGIDYRTQSRAKTPSGFYKKIMRKNYQDPWHECSDLLGVRIILPLEPLKDAAHVAIEAATDLSILRVEDGRKTADPRELRYSGLHLFLTMPDLKNHAGEPYRCEVQLKSEAENSWGDVEHRYVYKKPYKIRPELVHRFERLLVLVELFDEELATAVEEMRLLPEFQRFEFGQFLDERYVDLVGASGDEYLSILNLGLLIPDTGLIERYGDMVRAYIATSGELLTRVYFENGPASAGFDIDRDWLVTQPESLLVLTLLRDDPYGLRVTLTDTDLFEPTLALASMVGADAFS